MLKLGTLLTQNPAARQTLLDSKPLITHNPVDTEPCTVSDLSLATFLKTAASGAVLQCCLATLAVPRPFWP
jgi:hypothetical protein